ncbi:uncharacterized protein LOC111070340 [Drosophila obscura]|uniref:uncharacterized protein LOC111070340 n=1 Tax=Drosophila obscura TaxID=7282 RepID=UPI000BA04A92|nr:uncharacterized protein LOC111070340 [Drosophila obscura]
MKLVLGLLVLCVAIYSVIAASGIHQYIGGGGGGGTSDDSDEKLVWSDSVHSADTDAALSRLAALDNIGNDRAMNFDESNWGGDGLRIKGFDKDSNSASNSDSDRPHRGFQLIQF